MGRSSKRRGRAKKRSSFGNLWLVTGVIIIVFVASLFYLKDHKTRVKHKKANIVAAEAHAEKAKIQPKPTAKLEQPQFDFYTMLSSGNNKGKNVVANNQAEANTAIPHPDLNAALLPTHSAKPIPPTTIKKTIAKSSQATHYLLQVVATRDYRAADALRAQLILNGNNAKIEKNKVNAVTWYQINIGPYASLKAAKAAQKQLQDGHLKTKLVDIHSE